jgi:UDP-N-acetylglucosamine acyltransferase
VIHPTALVHPKAEIGEGAEVGPFCVVGESVRSGQRTKLLAHVVVNGHTTIGVDSLIHPFTSIGASAQDRKFHGERSFTRIGDRTTIREFCSVHRATGEDEVTSIGDDCLLWPTPTWPTIAASATGSRCRARRNWPGTCRSKTTPTSAA